MVLNVFIVISHNSGIIYSENVNNVEMDMFIVKVKMNVENVLLKIQ